MYFFKRLIIVVFKILHFMFVCVVAAEIAHLQTEVTSTKSEKENLTKSYEKLQQKAGQQVCIHRCSNKD